MDYELITNGSVYEFDNFEELIDAIRSKTTQAFINDPDNTKITVGLYFFQKGDINNA